MTDLSWLAADGRASTIPAEEDLFGFLAGHWDVDSEWTHADGSRSTGKGAIHAAWVLRGTLLQDVWEGTIDSGPGAPRASFGTTLRFFDPRERAWRCTWMSPPAGAISSFLARRAGSEIVLARQGSDERWIFSGVTREAFDWRAEERGKVVERVRARRVTT